MTARRILIRNLLILVLLCVASVAALGAAEVEIFRAETHDDFAAGTLEGVSVDPLGALELAIRVERTTGLDEPFIFTGAAHDRAWVAGTGNAGKVLEVRPDGTVTVLHEASEPEVFALWADADGTVFSGTSPRGKVYRLAGGEATVLFDPEESYIWDIARDAEGGLLVATGLRGRVYRIDRDGDAEVVLEANDSHVRSLALLTGGSVLAGTAGQGLILRLEADGSAVTLLDALEPEIVALTPRADGGAYAAALASEASQVDLSASQPQQDDEGEPTVTVVVQSQETVGSRAAGATGPRSRIFDIAPDGSVEEILSFDDETVHSLLWHAGDLWIGTGEEGHLYRYTDGELVLEKELEERQVTALVAGGAGVAAVTTNGGALYRLPGGREPLGTYTSAVLDAAQPARFGAFFWEGDLPPGAVVELSFRSGMSASPDATWSPWSEPVAGREASLQGLSVGRYAQWRATLRRQGESGPRITETELSYRQQNLRPKISKLTVLEPGQIVVPANFNPASQTFEPWSPNREGIFTTLRSAPPSDDGRLKTLWKKGYRTLQWEAEDGNKDELSYAVEVRPVKDGDASGSRDGWLRMVEDLEETYYSFDSTVLPDGVYRFRLIASDRAARSAEEALSAEKVSESLVIDHTPPRLVSRERRGGAVTVEIEDRLSPLRDAVYSVDAGDWQPVRTLDGLLDGRRETLRIEIPGDARLLLLRLTDAAHNVITFDLLDSASHES